MPTPRNIWIVTHAFYPQACAPVARVMGIVKYIHNMMNTNLIVPSNSTLPKKLAAVKLYKAPKLFDNRYLFPFYAAYVLRRHATPDSVVIVTVPTLTLSLCALFIPKKVRVLADFRDAPQTSIVMHNYKTIKAKIMLFLQKRLVKRATWVVATTKSVARTLGVKNCVIIPNGADTDQFKIIDEKALFKIRKSLSISKNSFVIGYLGRLDLEEKPEFLVDVASFARGKKNNRQDNLKFLIIGAGPKLLKLKKEVILRGLSEDVIFAGEIPHNKIPLYLNLVHVGFVSMHPAFSEIAVPTKIYEFLACGLPIITTLRGEAEEVLSKKGVGKIIREDVMEALEAILYYKNLPKPKFSKLRDRCLELAKTFSRESASNKLYQLISQDQAFLPQTQVFENWRKS